MWNKFHFKEKKNIYFDFRLHSFKLSNCENHCLKISVEKHCLSLDFLKKGLSWGSKEKGKWISLNNLNLVDWVIVLFNIKKIMTHLNSTKCKNNQLIKLSLTIVHFYKYDNWYLWHLLFIDMLFLSNFDPAYF